MDVLRAYATLLADWSQTLKPLLSLSVVCISASSCKFPEGVVTGGLRSCGSDPEPLLIPPLGTTVNPAAARSQADRTFAVVMIQIDVIKACAPVIPSQRQSHTRE